MPKFLRLCLTTTALLSSFFFAHQVLAQGSLEQIKVFGPSLSGNLEQDDPNRDVHVYLPPNYESSNKRYPVIYFLHGYGVRAELYVSTVLNLPDAANTAMAAGADDVIIVMPDAFTRYGGSFYSNSPTIGDWETFIAEDLVSYIDANYRTIPTRESRGLSGHSMGGYGTLRIGMTHPHVFNALYSMSAGGLLNEAPTQEEVDIQLARMAEGLQIEERSFANGMQSQAAAWAPNPKNPPFYFDLPYQNGEAMPLIENKWIANSLLVTVDQNVPALKQYKAIMIDVGNEDGLEVTNTQFDAALTRLGIAHGYEVYEGDHGNRIGQRFVDEVMPFFAEHLAVD